MQISSIRAWVIVLLGDMQIGSIRAWVVVLLGDVQIGSVRTWVVVVQNSLRSHPEADVVTSQVFDFDWFGGFVLHDIDPENEGRGGEINHEAEMVKVKLIKRSLRRDSNPLM